MDATVHNEYRYCKEKITFASVFFYSFPGFLSQEPAASCCITIVLAFPKEPWLMEHCLDSYSEK